MSAISHFCRIPSPSTRRSWTSSASSSREQQQRGEHIADGGKDETQHQCASHGLVHLTIATGWFYLEAADNGGDIFIGTPQPTPFARQPLFDIGNRFWTYLV